MINNGTPQRDEYYDDILLTKDLTGLTKDLTGLTKEKIKSLLKDYTHSEIRSGEFENGKFIPGDFLGVIKQKHILGINIITN